MCAGRRHSFPFFSFFLRVRLLPCEGSQGFGLLSPPPVHGKHVLFTVSDGRRFGDTVSALQGTGVEKSLCVCVCVCQCVCVCVCVRVCGSGH